MRILTIDIGGTAIKSGLFTGERELVEEREIPSDGKEGGEAVMRRALELIGTYRGFDRVGVSTAGQVDCASGSILYANENIPGYTGMRVTERITHQYNVPAHAENDVNCAAIGEAAYGAGAGKDPFLMLTYGTGIGGGVILGGRVFRGSGGRAGHLGHIITHVGGRACACGGRGCYEQYASTTALVTAAKKISTTFTNGREIFYNGFEENDEIVRVIDEWAFEIAAGLASLVHAFDPACIALGGGIMNERYLIDRIRARLPELVMKPYRPVEVVQARLKSKASLYGALKIALDHVQPHK